MDLSVRSSSKKINFVFSILICFFCMMNRDSTFFHVPKSGILESGLFKRGNKSDPRVVDTLEEEFNLFSLLKDSFPELDNAGLVIGIEEFVSGEGNLEDYICKPGSVFAAANKYILTKKPYLIFDTTEGYPCFFFRGNFLKIQYDAKERKIIRLADRTTETGTF